MAYPQQQPGAPPFNPGYPPSGHDPYQAPPPPPYTAQEPQMAPPHVGGAPPQGYYPQQPYPPQQYAGYPQQGGYPAQPYGQDQQQHTTVVYTQPQPTTTYVYQERKRDTSGEECALCALCAACLCCCLLSD